MVTPWVTKVEVPSRRAREILRVPAAARGLDAVSVTYYSLLSAMEIPYPSGVGKSIRCLRGNEDQQDSVISRVDCAQEVPVGLRGFRSDHKFAWNMPIGVEVEHAAWTSEFADESGKPSCRTALRCLPTYHVEAHRNWPDAPLRHFPGKSGMKICDAWRGLPRRE